LAASSRLIEVAEGDPSLAPYTDLLEVALAAAGDQVWSDAAGSLFGSAQVHLRSGAPVLHQITLVLPKPATQALYQRLRTAAGVQELPTEPQAHVLAEVLALRLPEGPSGTILQLTLLPLLMAVGRASADAVAEVAWNSGVCPVCAAWPALAESRGLERQRMLRCGRCGSAWQLPWQLCPFCANDQHAGLSYLYSGQTGEARRVFACDRCKGYLKTIATFVPLEQLDLPIDDLATLELDLAALDAGLLRPPQPGFELQVELRWS